MDYKLYLDFVLANMYKTTNEALQYHFRMLDLHKTGRLTVFEVRPKHRQPAPTPSTNPQHQPEPLIPPPHGHWQPHQPQPQASATPPLSPPGQLLLPSRHRAAARDEVL